MKHSTIVMTGAIGLFGALLVGAGEFLLHFDPEVRFENNQFFVGISDQRSHWGHFIGVLGAPLYLVGCWHIYQMLRPANTVWSFAAFAIMAYGFMVGVVWIGSRASLSAMVNAPASTEIEHLLQLYELRYETLLQVIRFAVLVLSAIFVWLTLTGRSNYPRWMAILNPILLIVASFVVFLIAPALGKYLMPIALNVAFAVFFAASVGIAMQKGV